MASRQVICFAAWKGELALIETVSGWPCTRCQVQTHGRYQEVTSTGLLARVRLSRAVQCTGSLVGCGQAVSADTRY
jgi:hypothetical protein